MAESRFKYQYEALGDHEFQLMVNAVLAHQFKDYVPLPLRQSDGGRDGLSGDAQSLVYQVKWSVNGREKNPVPWLDAIVVGEEENLRRLASEGAKRYILVTNVPSTGRPGTGTFDQIHERLTEHAAEYGFEQMTCIWREALDAFLDSAPESLLWKYPAVLSGVDAMRYLMASDYVGDESALRQRLRTVATVQWDEDERVKFSQVDIDRERVVDLYIDVGAMRLEHVGNRRFEKVRTRDTFAGAAAYLLKPRTTHETQPIGTLVRGAPGQGKSTLSQYVAQAHRSSFVPDDLRKDNLPAVVQPLYPIRFDLSDYARWMAGIDVWDTEGDQPKRSKRKAAAQATIECFVADLMTHACGGTTVTPDGVSDMFNTIPSLVVLDGLDEVGVPTVRTKVVTAIDKFASRCKGYAYPPRLIVTTRPSTNELEEPSLDSFELLVLLPFDEKQRDQYMRKWTAVRGITGSDGRNLRKAYRQKIAEPYLADLATNPMQLTILLDLLNRLQEATPTQRTALYDSYVELLLAREANKHPDSVKKHQDELKEMIPFLGWHLHARTESDPTNSKMTVNDLKATMRHFQRTYEKPEQVVDEMFEATTDRLWTLTSKTDGWYEFEVQSLREYFAARFLYRYAGEGQRGFDNIDVFRELLKRPYWLNTARFYGGNAALGEVTDLGDGVIEEMADDPAPPSVIAGWTLLTDGVFTGRPRAARNVLKSLCHDDNLKTLNDALRRGEVAPLPELPQPTEGDEDPTWLRLTAAIAAGPTDEETRLRVSTLRELIGQKKEFAAWWRDQILNVIETGGDATPWLEMAAECEAAAGLEVDLTGLDLEGELVTVRVLDTGLVPPEGSQFESDLIEMVLGGHAPYIRSTKSLPAQIAVAFASESFLDHERASFPDPDYETTRRRQEAHKYLKRRRPDLAAAARNRRFKAGQMGSTFPWSNTASAVFEAAGPSWLASHIAIIGAATPMNLGFNRKTGTTAFGAKSHPATLLQQTRKNCADTTWWKTQLDTLTKPNQRATERALAEWCAALWCLATPEVIENLYDDWTATFADLTSYARPVIDLVLRTSAHGYLRKFSTDLTATDPAVVAMLTFRNPGWTAPASDSTFTPHPAPVEHPALIEVARSNNWFKVDSQGAYR
ncbi:NACHT domain-containing protein [Nocardioides korecus]